jgi:hypothetical protein
MDLLGDLGATDQLTSTRAENKLLKDKVNELSVQVNALRVENETLKAEVEIYRSEAALPTFSGLALGKSPDNDAIAAETDAFVKSGDGSYPIDNQVTLPNLHGLSNPLCCALSFEDTVLATGGADSSLRLVMWGPAWTDALGATAAVVQNVAVVETDAPVICTAFCNSPNLRNVVAAGSMDGVVHLVEYHSVTGQAILQVQKAPLLPEWHHRKYVRAVSWAAHQPILATASADGSVHVYKVEKQVAEMDWSSCDDTSGSRSDLRITKLQSLHFPGAVESVCFVENQLVCYARGTPYLSYFDLEKDFLPTRLNLNKTGNTATGGFDEHVSFAVMDLKPSPCGQFLAAATDTSRNLIIDIKSGQQVRSLYGHQNDGYSQPKIAWSKNGSYLVGNTQDDSCLCVWDIASGRIVERLSGGHTSPIRDICAGHSMDCWVSTSFDKQTKMWFAPTR